MLLGAALLVPLAVATLIIGASAQTPWSTGRSGDFAFVAGQGRGMRLRRVATVLAPLAVLPAVALSVSAGAGETAEEAAQQPPQWEVPWLLFGAVFAVDPTARALVLVAALLFGAALMAVSWVKLRGRQGSEPGAPALSAFLLVCFSGTIGTYVAADVVSFYLAFAVMSFSAVGLVIHYRHEQARRAARIYLVMSVFSETAILGGLLLIAGAGGYLLIDAPEALGGAEHSGLIATLLLVGLGVKAGTVPLHVWLPLAHPAAPPAASAVLSGAMVKAGLVGWLRLFGEDADAGPVVTAGWVLLGLALLGAFAAVAVGVLQSDPKVVLAYSTISQMGFITVLVAVGMIVPELWEATTAAAVLYAVHHGLAKGVLFLGVPVVSHYGRGAWGVVVLVGMAGAALAVAGAPLTSGAYGKYVSKEAVEPIVVWGLGLDQVLPLVATGSTLLMMRFAHVMLRAEVSPRKPDAELFSWLGVCLAGVSLPWMIGQWWIPQAGQFSWEPAALWDASWPILLGLGVGAAVWWASSRGDLPGWVRADGSVVAPGDLVVAEESFVVRAGRATASAVDRGHEISGDTAERGSAVVGAGMQWLRDATERMERTVSGWRASGAVILLLLWAAAVVMAVMWWWR